jgi:zinc transporter ZupT
MDLSLINLKPHLLDIWCLLNTDVGKQVLGVLGLGGLVSIATSIRKIPKSTDAAITKRNAFNRRRRRTIAAGITGSILIVGYLLLYLHCKRLLIDLDAACSAAKAADIVVPWLLSLYAVGLVGLMLTTTFHIRASKPNV